MEVPTELEKFLENLKVSGQSDGVGSFTLAREKALEKMEEFQLPFAGAWIVKAFQSMIASGGVAPIAVLQTRRFTEMRRATQLGWSLADLEEAFFTPEPSGNRSIDHLVSALWVVGLKDKRGFEVSLPGQPQALLWDGTHMHTVPRDPGQALVLSVAHQSASGGTWLHDQVEASRRNSEVAKSLRDYCYTSPVPLTLDGRRLDGLHHCPHHGWNNRQFPLALAFIDRTDLPELRWPPGTFEKAHKAGNHALADGGGLEGITQQLLKGVPRTKQGPLAVLITAHARPETGEKQKEKNLTVWRLYPASSHCCWVQDGAQILAERLNIAARGVAVGYFLSAQDLPTDLTGFRLRDSEEKTRRASLARREIKRSVRALASVHLGALKSHNQKRYKILGNTVLVLAIGVGWSVPFVGPPAAMLMGLFGFMARFADRVEQGTLIGELDEALHKLKSSL